MKRYLIALALLLGGALATAPNYYPHKVGMSWTYTSGEVQTYESVRQMNGQQVWELSHAYDGKVRYTDYLTFDENGVWLLGVDTGAGIIPYDPPIQVYPAAPLRVGLSWSSRTRFKGANLVVVDKVIGVEGVVVPFGRYNAFVIRSSLTAQGGGASVVDLYFVPGIGVVRYATQDGGQIDLVDFKP
ncbi:hypothetical protein [Oceanithermus sp.]|jgi:hypothetical protein